MIDVLVSNLVGLTVAALTTSSQVTLWQRKEYRWDRLSADLKSSETWPPTYYWLLAAYSAVAVGWLAVIFGQTTAAAFLGWAALVCLLIFHLIRIFRQGIWRPRPTAKAMLLVIVMTGLSAGLAAALYIHNFAPGLQWATLIFFLPMIAAAAVGLINIPAYFVKQSIIKQAQRLRSSLPDLVAVGITGSYGKTSTKHFLQQILAGGQRASAVSAEHRNAAFTIAADMRHQLKPGLDIYVAEMGAYKRGDIAALARLVKPQIGVITAIGNQHLSLFGSQQNIAEAKWELIAGLQSPAIAVLNQDDETLVAKAKNFKGRTLWYSLQKPADVWAANLQLGIDKSTFVLHIGDWKKAITVPIISRGLVISLLAAVATAQALQIPPAQIFQKLNNLQSFPRTMQPRRGKKNALIIDDSYSASEASVINALDYLRRFPSADKRFVMVPVIELGQEAVAVHQKIGEQLAKSDARVYVYGSAFKKQLAVAAGRSMTWETDPHRLAQKVGENLSAESVVVLEGRLPAVVLKAVLNSTTA